MACEASFISERRDRLYCSKACKQAALRRRRVAVRYRMLSNGNAADVQQIVGDANALDFSTASW
jgi:hypothetical protein